MDVVDGQIVETLLRLDPSFFDGLPEIPNTITELDTETFYQAIVLLLWSCKESTKKEIPSRLLPNNMSAKFRCATNVADAVKSIGVRDPINYHMLLYGRSKELRNILIGLMEKLPKDSPIVTSVDDPLNDLIRSAICAQEKDDDDDDNDDDDDEAKWNKRCNTVQKHSWDLPERVNFMGFYGDILAALRYDDRRYCNRAFICSLLENNAIDNGKKQNYQSIRDGIAEVLQIIHPNISRCVKPQVKPKPILPPKPQKKREVKIDQKINEIPKEDAMLDKMLVEIEALTASVDRKKISETKMQSSENERLMVLQSKKFLEAEIDERLEKLLKNPDAISKLENYIDGSSERMQRLQNVWLKAKAEKDEEVNLARLAASSSTEYNIQYRNREASAKDAKLIENELTGKKKTLERLRKQVESREEKQINRSIYTKHIFDIVGNIRKQQDEINRIAAENLQLQKEIKSTAGKLERSFTVVEGRLYKDVEKDASMQKAYRLLMKIHGECFWVVSGIDSCGHLEEEIEELNDQIAMQQQRKTDEKLESIINDWMEVKKENATFKELLNGYHN